MRGCSAHLLTVLAPRLAVGSAAAIRRRNLLPRRAITVIVVDVGVGRVGRVVRGGLHRGAFLSRPTIDRDHRNLRSSVRGPIPGQRALATRVARFEIPLHYPARRFRRCLLHRGRNLHRDHAKPKQLARPLRSTRRSSRSTFSDQDREAPRCVTTDEMHRLDGTGLLQYVEQRRPTGRRFGADADARWSSFKGDLETVDRIELMMRDADAEYPASLGARVVYGLYVRSLAAECDRLEVLLTGDDEDARSRKPYDCSS